MLYKLTALAFMAAGIYALPSSSGSNHGFSVALQQKETINKITPAQMMARIAAKYKIENPADAKVFKNASVGSVPAVPTVNDTEYLAPVYVGEQLLYLDFDTGSSDLWVYSDQMPKAQQTNHRVYNPSDSSTAKQIANSSWMVNYGDGSYASGNVYTDCVSIGDTVVEDQGVETATGAFGSFERDSSDGLVGLGFDTLNSASPRQKTFMTNAIAQGLPQAVFTADLYPQAPGTYDFGYVDSSKHSGDIVYSDVDSSEGYWSVTMTGWSFGSGANEVSSSSYSQSTVVDTGTTINFLSVNVVRGYWATVPGSTYSRLDGGYIFPCDAELPDFTVRIGDFNGTIPGHLNNFAESSGGSGMCFGGLQSNEQLGTNILGDVFLKTVFAVFDKNDPPCLGLAPKAKNTLNA